MLRTLNKHGDCWLIPHLCRCDHEEGAEYTLVFPLLPSPPLSSPPLPSPPLPSLPSDEEVLGEDLVAFSEEELASLYPNPQLAANQLFVNNFLPVCLCVCVCVCVCVLTCTRILAIVVLCPYLGSPLSLTLTLSLPHTHTLIPPHAHTHPHTHTHTLTTSLPHTHPHRVRTRTIMSSTNCYNSISRLGYRWPMPRPTLRWVQDHFLLAQIYTCSLETKPLAENTFIGLLLLLLLLLYCKRTNKDTT